MLLTVKVNPYVPAAESRRVMKEIDPARIRKEGGKVDSVLEWVTKELNKVIAENLSKK